MTNDNDARPAKSGQTNCTCQHGDAVLWRALRVIHDCFWSHALADWAEHPRTGEGEHIFRQFQTLNCYLDLAFEFDWFRYGEEERLTGHPCPHELHVRRIHARVMEVFRDLA